MLEIGFGTLRYFTSKGKWTRSFVQRKIVGILETVVQTRLAEGIWADDICIWRSTRGL